LSDVHETIESCEFEPHSLVAASTPALHQRFNFSSDRRIAIGDKKKEGKSLMPNPAVPKKKCLVCRREFPVHDLFPAAMLRPGLNELIQKSHPAWSNDSFICFGDLNRFRTNYVQAALVEERGQLSQLEQDVIQSLHEQEILAANTNIQFDRNLTFGERLADQIADLGGSWTFILCFAAVLAGWISFNSWLGTAKPFDPFPFILLNLVLSCLAAVQAPVIMMSQNRQEAKDRMRAEHDYCINLKAELEIRHLHAKLDLLLTHQWQRLLEIQEIQIELMEEVARRKQTDGD
jgi:uncharacterized membrane protein